MSTAALVMMIITLVVIWGGFLISVKQLPDDES